MAWNRKTTEYSFLKLTVILNITSKKPILKLFITSKIFLNLVSGSNQCLRDYLLVVIIDRAGKEHVSQRYCDRLDTLSLPVFNTLQSNAQIVFVSSDASMERYRCFRLHYSFVREGKICIFKFIKINL